MECLREKAKGAGFAARLAELEEVERLAEERRVDEVLASTFGVPERNRDALKQLRELPALKHVRTWQAQSRKDHPFLVLAGPPGTGKSIAAAWYLAQVARAWRLQPGFLRRRWWGINDLQRIGNWGDELDHIWSTPSLVIDDLGAEFADAKGNFASLLFGIVEKRSANYLRTIITTNLTPEALRARYDSRVFDRLRDGATFASVAGASLRGRRA